MENNNKNVSIVVELDDGETWCSEGYVHIITEETKKLFLEEREVEVEDGDDVDELFWEEMMEDKASRELWDIAEHISVSELLAFYIENRK